MVGRVSFLKCALWDSFPSLFNHSQVLLTVVSLKVSKCDMLMFRLERSCLSYALDAYDDRTGCF